WLNAHSDPVASLYTFTNCMALADLNGDGDHKLIVADLGTGVYDMKLKVWKGTSLVSETTIIDLPTGVCTFHMDATEPRVPAVGVASGPFIYVYKNLKPFFKFTLPPLEVNKLEQELWEQAREEKIDALTLKKSLERLKDDSRTPLTIRSLRYVLLEQSDLEAFLRVHKHTPLKRQTVITAIAALKKSHADDDAISCLVVGTESQDVYVLDSEAYTVLAKMTLPSVPVFLSVSGLFDVEYRIVVACRNGNLYTLKRGAKHPGKSCIELKSQPVGIERIGKNIIVGCMDQTLNCFTTKGKRIWSLDMPDTINTLELLSYKARGIKAVLVALNNGETRIYRDKFLVNVIKTQDPVTGLKFGRFGREDCSLILVTKAGGLSVRILKRNTTFETKDTQQLVGAPSGQNLKLNVPRKTKLFVDQMQRERENYVSMHRTFQHDLYRLRLESARSYVRALTTSLNPVSALLQDPLKLSATVQGIGPVFKLTINLQNTSANNPSFDLLMTSQYDDALYKLDRTYIQIPMIVPGLSYNFEIMVECLSDKGISDNIKVFVLHKGKSSPIITAVISMPISEGAILP
ncbi:uncharacterized protein TRIADDRAFT_26650, partial [Trichoplax adhaerens]